MPTLLSTLHLLLTYKCALRCPHCYVYGSPRSKGSLDLTQIRAILEQAARVGSVQWIYFEGGEPFLRFSLLLKSIQKARQYGFTVGVITNGYFARSEETAVRFLEPLLRLGVADLRVSNDCYHYKAPGETPAQRALKAAARLGLPVTSLELQTGKVQEVPGSLEQNQAKVSRLKLCGRAAENLTAELPGISWESFTACPQDDLSDLWRLSIDAFGNCQPCQGISIGNIWQTSLGDLIAGYQVESHPVCGPLVKGGPARLARKYPIEHADYYADACHCCYDLRRRLIDRFPTYLAPAQVYGL